MKYKTEKEPLLKKLNIHQKINLKSMVGEVLLFDNLPADLMQANSYGVPNSEWIEPIETKCEYLLSKYSNLPFESTFLGYKRPIIGIQCDGRNWYRIKGYQEPEYSPGSSWREEKINQ